MSILVAVMLPSLLCVPMTLIRVPAVMALAATALPAWVYWVLAVVWTVTELPLAVLATMVLPLTLDTVSASHWPCAPGVAASGCALLKSPWVVASVWELLVLPCVRAAAWVALVVEPRSVPMPRASMKARARPPIRSHLRPRLGGAGG